MSRTRAHDASRLAYPGTMAMLALAFAFPIALMIFDPTLMFERGWEQYVGTAIYFWAVVTLGRELLRLWKNERAFVDAPGLLDDYSAGQIDAKDDDDPRVLPVRLRQLARHAQGTASPSVGQLMELNREGSSLDQEHAAGRFTLTKYILYLLPVIGFIGTVEGISGALHNMSSVLPEVTNLGVFLEKLPKVTSALQIAFDSTLLALFLSAALMLVQTLVYRRAEDLLARIDRWVVAHVLPRLGTADSAMAGGVGVQIEALRRDFEAMAARMGEGFGPHVGRFAEAVDRLPSAMSGLLRGAEAIGRVGDDLQSFGEANETLRRGVATLARIETAMTSTNAAPDEQLEQIKQGIDRSCEAIEGLAGQWSQAYERTNRTTQEQLARTLNNLKDALDMLNVSMEQGNSLYRNIVKKMFDERSGGSHEGIRAA